MSVYVFTKALKWMTQLFCYFLVRSYKDEDAIMHI